MTQILCRFDHKHHHLELPSDPKITVQKKMMLFCSTKENIAKSNRSELWNMSTLPFKGQGPKFQNAASKFNINRHSTSTTSNGPIDNGIISFLPQMLKIPSVFLYNFVGVSLEFQVMVQMQLQKNFGPILLHTRAQQHIGGVF